MDLAKWGQEGPPPTSRAIQRGLAHGSQAGRREFSRGSRWPPGVSSEPSGGPQRPVRWGPGEGQREPKVFGLREQYLQLRWTERSNFKRSG